MASTTIQQHARNKSLLFQLDEFDGVGFTASDVLHELLVEYDQQSFHEQTKLINDAQEAHALALSPSGEVNLERFAQLLAMRGHHVWLRTGRLDCGCGQVALRHTFVLAGASGSSGSDLMPQLFVVDPSFKEQFQLPNATPEYSALFQDLPNLFVGTAEQLVPIVELMCTQMQQVFADTSTSCPPWRTPSCMLTKWLPSTADDVPVTAPGSTDGDRSTSLTSSTTNSALSSPAAPHHSSSSSTMLAPLRIAGAADAGDGAAGRSPLYDGRSPLYYDQDSSDPKAFFAPGSPILEDAAGQHGFGPGTARQSLFVHWAEDSNGQDVQAGGKAASGSFMGSGSWGVGQFGSTVSSPGCDVVWGSLPSSLRQLRSEHGSGHAPEQRSPARSVAIAARSNHRVDQSRGNGFAEALMGRADLAQLTDFSPDAVLPQRCVSDTAAMRAASSASRVGGSGFFGAYRSQVVAGNPTLDISRFDRNSMDDLIPAGPVAWGVGSMGGIAAGLAARNPKPPAGAVCPPVPRRPSSTNSQCSALSAAIAGKGVPMR